MKRLFVILILHILLLLPSCVREPFEPRYDLPDGTPVTICIGFGAEEQYDVQVGTKAASSHVDESRVHDLYVMIFDESGNKFYGRNFTFEHLTEDLSDLVSQPNEGWFVDNVTVGSPDRLHAGPAGKSCQYRFLPGRPGCADLPLRDQDPA